MHAMNDRAVGLRSAGVLVRHHTPVGGEVSGEQLNSAERFCSAGMRGFPGRVDQLALRDVTLRGPPAALVDATLVGR